MADINKIFKNVHKLRGSSISIQRDLPTVARKKKGMLLKVKAELNRICPEKRVRLRDNKLFVEGKTFRWSEGVGLTLNGDPGATVLSGIMKTDVSAFLSSLSDVRRGDEMGS